jgi:hypothetical protein
MSEQSSLKNEYLHQIPLGQLSEQGGASGQIDHGEAVDVPLTLGA